MKSQKDQKKRKKVEKKTRKGKKGRTRKGKKRKNKKRKGWTERQTDVECDGEWSEWHTTSRGWSRAERRCTDSSSAEKRCVLPAAPGTSERRVPAYMLPNSAYRPPTSPPTHTRKHFNLKENCLITVSLFLTCSILSKGRKEEKKKISDLVGLGSHCGPNTVSRQERDLLVGQAEEGHARVMDGRILEKSDVLVFKDTE